MSYSGCKSAKHRFGFRIGKNNPESKFLAFDTSIFLYRRAKAKLQDGKHKGRSGSAETPPDTPPELSTGFEVDLHNLIHEDERM